MVYKEFRDMCLCQNKDYKIKFAEAIDQLGDIAKMMECQRTHDEDNVYTLHGRSHIQHVYEIINTVVNDKWENYGDIPLFYLSFAIIFHDLGMIEGRINHAVESANKFLEISKNISSLNKTEIEIISVIIEAHGYEIDDKLYKYISKYEDNCKNIYKTVALLRFGDIMDFTEARLPTNVIIKKIPFSSYLHWKKHKLFTSYIVSSSNNYIVNIASKLQTKWISSFVRKELSYVHKEFENAKKEGCVFPYRDIVMSEAFKVKEQTLKEQERNEDENIFKPYSRFEERNYYNLYGREDEILEIIWDIFSAKKATIIYGKKGIGKSSLIKCGLANAFQTFSDDINWIYIENYNDLKESLKKYAENDNKQVIVLDQLEKCKSINDCIDIVYNACKEYKDEVRFVFSVSNEYLSQVIKKCTELNYDFSLKCINEISIQHAVEYVMHGFNLDPIKDKDKCRNIKNIVSYIRSVSDSVHVFNNQLNILFNYLFLQKELGIVPVEELIEKDLFQKSIKSYHDKLFCDLSLEHKTILNRYVNRKDLILSLEPQANEQSLFIDLTSQNQILRLVENNKFEFIHSQLLRVYREGETYCSDENVKKKIKLENNFEKNNIERKDIDNTSLSEAIDLNMPLFDDEDQLRRYVIAQFIKCNKFKKKIKDIYKVDLKDLLSILYKILKSQTNRKEILYKSDKFRNLIHDIYDKKDIDKLVSNIKEETVNYQNLLEFLLLEGYGQSISFEDLQIDKNSLFYVTDKLRKSITEFVCAHLLAKNLFNTQDDSFMKFLIEEIYDESPIILQSLFYDKINIYINDYMLYYFCFYFSKNINSSTLSGEINYTTKFVLIEKSDKEYILSINKEDQGSFYSCFYDKKATVYMARDKNEVIAAISDNPEIELFQLKAFSRLLLNLKLNKESSAHINISPISNNFYNFSNSESIERKIKLIEESSKKDLQISLTNKNKKHGIFKLDQNGTTQLFYHINYYSLPHKVDNIMVGDSIQFNKNASPILFIIIGHIDNDFLERYKNICSFYLFFDNRIALVSKAIDAWCYEVMKVRKLLEHNRFIKYIYIINKSGEDVVKKDKASEFLQKIHGRENISEPEYAEIKMFCNSDWSIFENVNIEYISREILDDGLIELFAFNECSPENDIVIYEASATALSSCTPSKSSIEDGHSIPCRSIEGNSFMEVYVKLLNEFSISGLCANNTREIIGLSIIMENGESLLKEYKRKEDFYRKIEIDKYYNDQWKNKDGDIYKYIHSEFDVNQIDLIVDIIRKSIGDKRITRKGAFAFYRPSWDKRDTIDSLFSCFVIIHQTKNGFSLDPYFVWRSNECVFGILLSLVNSLRWFKECVFDKIRSDIDSDIDLSIDHYYYHGINMHIEDNELINEMIDKLIQKYSYEK